MSAAPDFSYSGDLTGQIAKNDALIDERHQQIDTVLSFTEAPTRPIGHNEAIDFDRARNITVAELRKDFDTLFARYNALIPELCAMNDSSERGIVSSW